MSVTSHLRRLQEYIHWNAHALSSEVTSCGPFSLYRGTPLDARSCTAIPRVEAPEPVQSALAQLRSSPGATGTTVHLTFVRQLFPDLPAALQAAGFARLPEEALMVCAPDTLRMPQAIPNLAISTLASDASVDELQQALDVNEQGFDPGYDGHASSEDAERFRQTLTGARLFVARLGGIPVAGGMSQAPHRGITRLDGIATLEPYRRRGIGARLSATMTQTAFTAGVRLAFLAAADDAAERLYTRVGYRSVGSLASFVDERQAERQPP